MQVKEKALKINSINSHLRNLGGKTSIKPEMNETQDRQTLEFLLLKTRSLIGPTKLKEREKTQIKTTMEHYSLMRSNKILTYNATLISLKSVQLKKQPDAKNYTIVARMKAS